LEAFGIVFNPDSLMTLPSDATNSNLQQFALKELKFSFTYCSKDRLVEEGNRRSPTTIDFNCLHREYVQFLRMIADRNIEISKKPNMGEILEAFLNSTI
jgi:hypothetical protein